MDESFGQAESGLWSLGVGRVAGLGATIRSPVCWPLCDGCVTIPVVFNDDLLDNFSNRSLNDSLEISLSGLIVS